jgi:hypothetical protein
VIDGPTLTAEQHVETTITVPDTYARQLVQPCSESFLGRPDAAVPDARARKPVHLARTTLAELEGRRRPIYEHTLPRRPQSFSLRLSCRMRLSRVRSATIDLS